jgi:membrane fusion protein (multidrug efflux system)
VRPGPTTRPLRLDETITGQIATTGAARGISVPMSALIPDSAGSYHVFVVKGGVARATPVETGARSDSTVQITKGVAAGDVVVTTGAYGIEDSAKVTVPRQ